MTRAQIQLPDELYQRAKAFAAQRELSLAEVTRRGLELFLDRLWKPCGMNPRPRSLSQNPKLSRLQLDDELMRAGRVRANKSNAKFSHTRREHENGKSS